MIKIALVLFLGIIMVGSTFSMSSSDALLPENLPEVSQAPYNVRVIEGENIIAYARPLYTTLDDPSNHVVPTTDSHDGVAKLILTRTDGTFGCSGTLANDSLHVITAAHCVADANGNYILTSGSATFEGNSESITISIDAPNSESHPNYDGDFIKGNDIAILKLASPAPPQVPGIPHATSDNSVLEVVDKKGYGQSGFLSTGADPSTYGFGTERSGQNKYDDFADTMYLALGLKSGDDFIPQAIYQYDSDDGDTEHDAFDFFFKISDLGLDTAEVISAPGDSGGPTILNGELVGVTSYGITLEFTRGPPPRTSDCTTEGISPILDSSCGEFAGDTRVSSYSSYIDSFLNPVNDVEPPVISAINVDASSTTSTITWTTDEPATSRTDYGLDTNYGSIVSDSTLVTSHSMELTGLSSSTTYHFKVTSEDSSNNSASSGDLTFTTTSPPTLQSISVTPAGASIPIGSTQQYTATGTFSDTSTADITNQVTWASSDSLVATIDAAGSASAVSEGVTTISATSGAVVGSTTLTVTAQASDIVEITKAEFNTRNGQLRVQATSTDLTATLTVVGYGEMTNNGDGTYSFRAKSVEDPGDTITVTSSSGGSDIAPVKHK